MCDYRDRTGGEWLYQRGRLGVTDRTRIGGTSTDMVEGEKNDSRYLKNLHNVGPAGEPITIKDPDLQPPSLPESGLMHGYRLETVVPVLLDVSWTKAFEGALQHVNEGVRHGKNLRRIVREFCNNGPYH